MVCIAEQFVEYPLECSFILISLCMLLFCINVIIPMYLAEPTEKKLARYIKHKRVDKIHRLLFTMTWDEVYKALQNLCKSSDEYQITGSDLDFLRNIAKMHFR